MELLIHFWKAFQIIFVRKRSWDIWVSDLFLFIKTDQTVPSSQNTVEKKQQETVSLLSVQVFLDSIVPNKFVNWFFLEFLYKVFSVCPDFLCSLTHCFSPSSFHTHSLAPLPPRQVRSHPVSFHSGTRRGWSGSYGSTPILVLHYFGQLYLYFNHLLCEGDELLLHVTPVYV